MNKAIMIQCCRDCQYEESRTGDDTYSSPLTWLIPCNNKGYYCSVRAGDPEIPDRYSIPSWCPLQDYKQEGE